MNEKFLNILRHNIIPSVITIIVGIILYLIINKAINSFLKRKTISNKKKTLIKLINNIVKYILLILILLVILELNGINITSIIAGLGVATLVAGLALQDALKDIIMGFNLIFDNYFSVGDVIQIDNITGKVLELGIKATKIRDIYTNSIMTIANRNIDKAIVISNWLDIDLPLPYEKSKKDIETIIKIIEKECKKVNEITNIEYKGIQEFDSSSINYKIRIYCKPEDKPQVLRDANNIIKEVLDDNKLSVPYTQIRLK